MASSLFSDVVDLRNIEDDVLSLWGLLWNSGMVGSVKRTDKTGKEKVRYFLNDYGKEIFSLLVRRYKLEGFQELESFLAPSETPKVLIICPFCGGKTEQGLLSCQKCGAQL